MVAASVLVLVGCTPDQTPVPVQADGAFVCEGVQRQGVELTLGGAVKVDQSHGSWARATERAFTCRLVPKGNDARSVSVIATRAAIDLPPSIDGQGSSQATLEERAAEADATAIVSEVEGEGFLFGPQRAQWLCGDLVLTVDFIGSAVKGRDSGADIEALLVSMLPWACDGQDAPQASDP